MPIFKIPAPFFHLNPISIKYQYYLVRFLHLAHISKTTSLYQPSFQNLILIANVTILSQSVHRLPHGTKFSAFQYHFSTLIVRISKKKKPLINLCHTSSSILISNFKILDSSIHLINTRESIFSTFQQIQYPSSTHFQIHFFISFLLLLPSFFPSFASKT